MHFVLGTAGHIDHGKSSLVKALTGTDPDRLKEERERGMTTDLGFAFLGDDITIIDVPGHERFVRHMLAGASTIDMVMLVVAADDGVMPQTREHFEICRLLGIRKGIIVINKIDLVDSAMVELVREEIKELVKGSFLEGAPVYAVSARTGEGIEDLKQGILNLTRELERKPDRGVFRMPIDRCFTIKGFGVVVAGTVLSGSCRIGDRLELLPEGIAVRVRGVQRHNQPVIQAFTGERAALNLQGVELEQVYRGQVVVTPGYYHPSNYIQATLYLLKSSPVTLRNMARFHLHVGTAEVMCRVCLLDKRELEPGEEGLVQLRTERPVVCDYNDRYVLRSASPLATIGGGVILEVGTEKLRRFDENVISRLNQLRAGEQSSVLEQLLLKNGFDVKTISSIARSMAVTENEVWKIIQRLIDHQQLVILDFEGKKYVIHNQVLNLALQRILAVLTDFHHQNPLRMGMKLSELRIKAGQLPPVLFDLALSQLQQQREVIVEGDRARLKDHTLQLKPEERNLFDRVAGILMQTRWSPPDLTQLFFGIDPKLAQRVRVALVESGTAVDLGEGIFMHAQAVSEAKEVLMRLLAEKGEVAATDFRQALGTTRKYVIPLLNYFDNIGLTQRKGDVRILKSRLT